MTRFARKGGINEKKEDKKKKEEATEWNDMFTDQTEFGQNKIEQKIENSRFERHRNFASNEKFNHKFKSNDDFALRKYYKLLDREIVDELVDLKNKRKISNREMFEKLEREVRSNKRRERRQVERENKRVCYKCRKPGHSVNECPQIDNDTEQGTGICYKCGSTEHSVYNCKVKVEPGKYPYAKCFICNEIGHITKQCPDNPRGLYPNGNYYNLMFNATSYLFFLILY
jgi:zinc finger CCHC domain-containing protein 9